MTETSQEKRTPEARRRRVNRLKRMILTTIVLLILLPLLGCITLGFYIHRIKNELHSVRYQYEWMERLYLEEKDKADRLEALLGTDAVGAGSQDVPQNNTATEPVDFSDLVVDEGIRKVYLTFDDGPSEQTERILDLLDRYQVKATFFVTGKPVDRYGDVYRRIVKEGHTLGMHSYSHSYSKIYASEEAFGEDLKQLQDLLYQETGTTSSFYRFPGGSSNTVSRVGIGQLITYLKSQNIVYFDWNVSAGDATAQYMSKESIVNRVLSQVGQHQEAVVLLHDAGDKKTTVDALPEIIEAIQNMEDTVLLPISADTMPIQHISAEAEE